LPDLSTTEIKNPITSASAHSDVAPRRRLVLISASTVLTPISIFATADTDAIQCGIVTNHHRVDRPFLDFPRRSALQAKNTKDGTPGSPYVIHPVFPISASFFSTVTPDSCRPLVAPVKA
jgi:hypothetical protein